MIANPPAGKASAAVVAAARTETQIDCDYIRELERQFAAGGPFSR
jgi:hypothetical protein